jgi:hypothetical protein
MGNVSAPGEPGWLGNPYVAVDAGGQLSRQEATERFGQLVDEKMKDPAWRQAFLELRGKQVGYYKPDEPAIHLHALQERISKEMMNDGRRVYAGIGSRQTPPEVLDVMRLLAGKMEEDGWLLRSGGAAGADAAFEAGVKDPAKRAIFLPGPSFNGRRAGAGGYFDSTQLPGWQAALETVNQYHPAPERLSPFARNLMARNAMQALGPYLDRRANAVVAWTPGGLATGGTGQALRMAQDLGIEVRNLGRPEVMTRARRYLGLEP